MREKYVKGCFALSCLLVSDFLIFNVLFWSSIKKFKVQGSQILESWVLGPESGALSLGSWVLILDYALKKCNARDVFLQISCRKYSVLIFYILRLVSRPQFAYNFSRKMFLILYSTNWPNFIAWLPLRLEILGNMCIVITCRQVCAVMNLKINLSFLTRSVFYITKKSGQKCKYLKNEQSLHEIKSVFCHF